MIDFEDLYPDIGASPQLREGPPKRVGSALAKPTRGRKNPAAYYAHSYPTKVPPEAIEPFLEHHTRRGHVVLDPFCGSGTTGAVALSHGRDFLGVELNPEYARLAERRLADTVGADQGVAA